MKRSQFISLSALAVLGLTMFHSCKQTAKRWMLRVTGTNHILGHRLWSKDFPKPTESIKTKYLLVGGGISALAAARALSKRGESDFLLVEMESQVGGNAAFGENEHSKYPLGAHYVPGINLHDTDLKDFFEEEGIILGYDAQQMPIYHPEYVCHTPESRLFIDYEWINGVEPLRYASSSTWESFQKFHDRMDELRNAKDENGKFAFDLPIAFSSKSDLFVKWDKITMKEWLRLEKLDDNRLDWFVNYCCLDDFGKGMDEVSAWAGIHYFTARKHQLYNANHNLLTWPEGNGFLVNLLSKYVKDKQKTNHLVYDIKTTENGVEALIFDGINKKTKRVEAEKVIMATPQYINKYVIPRELSYTNFEYAPWIVATLVIDRFPTSEGVELSWENVIYQGKGLGYVYAQHQHLGVYTSPFVLTYYRALDGESKKERKRLLNESDKYWEEEVLADLKNAHPLIVDHLQTIEIHKRGHGMIAPKPGFLNNETRLQAAKSIADKIYFAHTDLSGISLFEEAFYQGNKVVKEIFHD